MVAILGKVLHGFAAIVLFLLGAWFLLWSEILALGVHAQLEWYVALPLAFGSLGFVFGSYLLSHQMPWQAAAQKAVQLVLAFASLNLLNVVLRAVLIVWSGPSTDEGESMNFFFFQTGLGVVAVALLLWFRKWAKDV